MTIVHIVEALGGGVYTYFNDLSHFFGNKKTNNEINTFIIYSSKRKEIKAENIKKDFSKDVTLIEIDMSAKLSPIADLKSTYLIYKQLQKIKPDVIHLHSSKAGVIGRWANLLRFNKSKIFYTPHGYSFLRQDITKNKQIFFRFIEKYSQKLFGGTTIACGDTEFEIAKTLGKSELLRNGIDFDKISSYYSPIQTEKLTFGIVGRITSQKNPKLFNDIALRFPNYQFIWIGDGELKNEITSENIKITGWFYNNKDVYNWINQIDVFLQTSLWEGLPLAVLEAMAFKKPIVATNVIGNKDIVLHGKNGFLFDNINELDNYFRLLENAAFRKKMGENAFKLCNEKFDMNKNFNLLPEIYTK